MSYFLSGFLTILIEVFKLILCFYYMLFAFRFMVETKQTRLKYCANWSGKILTKKSRANLGGKSLLKFLGKNTRRNPYQKISGNTLPEKIFCQRSLPEKKKPWPKKKSRPINKTMPQSGGRRFGKFLGRGEFPQFRRKKKKRW